MAPLKAGAGPARAQPGPSQGPAGRPWCLNLALQNPPPEPGVSTPIESPAWRTRSCGLNLAASTLCRPLAPPPAPPLQVSLASDFMWNLNSREASASFGYDYILRQCRLRGRIDTGALHALAACAAHGPAVWG